MADTDSGFFAQAAYDAQQPRELKLLSSSSYAMIWRGNRDGRFRIFKCLSPEHRGDPLYERMLRKEFEIGYNLQHPNICNFYSFTTLPDLGNCIEMEWIDGCTLADLAAAGPLTDRNLCRQIISEVCDALSYMHAKHIVHRDLKPSNIMISHIGRHVSLIDFGLSDSESHSILKSPAGTQFFAAPELVAGQSPDWRSDIYSLGRTIASTMKPFGDVAGKCCRSDREKRYQSAQKVKEALGRRGGWKYAGALAAASVALAAIVLSFVPTSAPSGDVRSDADPHQGQRSAQAPHPNQTMQSAETIQAAESLRPAESMQTAGAALPTEVSAADNRLEQQQKGAASPQVSVQTKVAHKALPERTAPPEAAAKSESADKAAKTIDAATIDSLFRKATELFK